MVSPAVVSFGNQPENTTSLGQTVTIANSGSGMLTISAIGAVGPDTAPFVKQANTCLQNGPQNGVLLTGQSCSIIYAFAPTTLGSFTDVIDVTDDSGGVSSSLQTITLTGTGIPAAPVANLSPSALNFGNVLPGNTSVAQAFTLTNLGSAALNLTSVVIAGTNSSDFAIVPGAGTTCPVASGTLLINASCTVAVQFAPPTSESVGSKSATLNFTDNVSGGLQAVALSGECSRIIDAARVIEEESRFSIADELSNFVGELTVGNRDA